MKTINTKVAVKAVREIKNLRSSDSKKVMAHGGCCRCCRCCRGR